MGVTQTQDPNDPYGVCVNGLCVGDTVRDIQNPQLGIGKIFDISVSSNPEYDVHVLFNGIDHVYRNDEINNLSKAIYVAPPPRYIRDKKFLKKRTHMNGYQCLGASTTPTRIGDFSLADLGKGLGEAAQGIYTYESGKSQAEAQQKTDTASLNAAIAADQAASAAVAQAAVSASFKINTVDADMAAAKIALAAQDSAAAGLSPDLQKKRADAAQKALAQATKNWQATVSSGGNAYAVAKAKALVDAWGVTYAKTQNSMFVDVGKKGGDMADHPGARAGGGGSGGGSGTNWGLVAGVGAGLAAVVGGLVWWLKARKG